MMEISNLIPHIEALIFASEKPLTTLEITDLINNAFGFMEDKIMLDQIESSIEGIIEKYKAEFYPFEVRESGGGWQFLTKKDFHKTVAQLNGEKFLKRLSTAALETLSIVAYKQPVTKSEIEAIRGVSSDYAIQKLLEKDLIVITGRNETLPGHPLVYGTSKNFMDYFGLNTTDDLPKLKEVFDDNIVIPTGVSAEGIAAQSAAEGEGAEEAVEEETTPSANGTHLNGTELTYSEEGTEEATSEYEQETDEESIAEEAEALDEEAGEVLDEIAEEGYDEEETSGEAGEDEETYITPEEGEEETYADDDSTSFIVDEDGELVEEHSDKEQEEEEEELEGEDEESEEDEEEEFDEEEEEADEEEEVEGEEETEDEEGAEDEEEAGDDDDNEADDEEDKKDEEKK